LYQRAMASTARVLDVLDTQPKVLEGTRTLEPGAVSGDVRFLGVSFTYPSGARALEGLELELRAGQTVGIVGPTGSGKTTLVKLLLRFYDPTQGSITLDGVPLPALQLATLRRAIG